MSDRLKTGAVSCHYQFSGCEVSIQIGLNVLDCLDAVTQFATDAAISAQQSETNHDVGAEARFVGRVRGLEPAPAAGSASPAEEQSVRRVERLELEHYPAMTESALKTICEEAVRRWAPLSVAVSHRVGPVSVGEPIVMVEVRSSHRQAAFDSCAFVMDFLKTSAPFWKQAIFDDGSSLWIEQKHRDRDAVKSW